MLTKKSTQGINIYADPQIEKYRYNPARIKNRIKAENAYKNNEHLDFPLHVIVETSSLCNLKCGFCNRETMTRPQQNMTLDMFKTIVDQCAEGGVHSISMYALGEPFINKDLGKMIIHAKKMGIPYVDVSTNGMYDMRSVLGTELNELIISIDGYKFTHEKLRPGADYDKIMDNIREFMMAKKHGRYNYPFIRMQIIDIPETHDDIEAYTTKWLKKADVVYIKGLEIMAQNLGDKNLSQKDIDKLKEKRVPCKQLSFVLTITSTGDISYCCHDGMGKSVIGNINKMTLKEAWDKVKPIRDKHLKGEYTELCSNCVDYKW